MLSIACSLDTSHFNTPKPSTSRNFYLVALSSQDWVEKGVCLKVSTCTDNVETLHHHLALTHFKVFNLEQEVKKPILFRRPVLMDSRSS